MPGRVLCIVLKNDPELILQKPHGLSLGEGKELIREECQFMELFYKELIYMLHNPANNHNDYEWAFIKYGHHRNLLPKKEGKK
jgi:hypothetical protein